MGKTTVLIALLVSTKGQTPLESADGLVASCATLIIVPAALISQWEHEITKAAGDLLRVCNLEAEMQSRGGADAAVLDSPDFLKRVASHDVILVTYDALRTSAKFYLCPTA